MIGVSALRNELDRPCDPLRSSIILVDDTTSSSVDLLQPLVLLLLLVAIHIINHIPSTAEGG
jgi:hypothetical protein